MINNVKPFCPIILTPLPAALPLHSNLRRGKKPTERGGGLARRLALTPLCFPRLSLPREGSLLLPHLWVLFPCSPCWPTPVWERWGAFGRIPPLISSAILSALVFCQDCQRQEQAAEGADRAFFFFNIFLIISTGLNVYQNL